MTREELIVEYIRTLEISTGDSWMDQFAEDGIFHNISFLMGYWSVKFPELYSYLMKDSNNTIPWKYPQDGLIGLVESFYIDDEEYENNQFDNEEYEKSLYPWASIIAFNPIYMNRFLKCHKDFLEWFDTEDDWYEEVPELNELIEKMESYETI